MDEQRQHIEELRQTHLRRLRELEKQAATLGIRTPPEITTEIEDIRATIAALDEQLGPAARRMVPNPVPDFVGRDSEIARLFQSLSQRTTHSTAAIVGIRGLGGIGKTQLAFTIAQRLASLFPDAQLLVELRGASNARMSATQAIQSVIRAFDREAKLPDDLTGLQERYRALLHGKRVFILADDAKDTAQVKLLIPPPGCALLITSRQRFTLPGMVALDLDMLSPHESADLVLAICPRIGEAALQLAKLCGYLPLALRVSASVLANDDTRSVARYLRLLADEHTRLAQLRDPDDATLDVETILGFSYGALEPEAQMALRHLSIFPSGFDRAAAMAVANLPDEEQSTELLGLLRRRSLLDWDPMGERLSLHDLVRAFAAARRDDDSDVRLRYIRHYLQVAQRVDILYRQGGKQALAGLALFDQERAHIDASLTWLGDQGSIPFSDRDAMLLDYMRAIEYISDLRYDTRHDYIPRLEAALAAARRLGRMDREGVVLSNLGNAYRNIGQLHRSIELYEQCLSITRMLGQRRGEGYILGNLGRIYYSLGDYPRARDLFQQRVDIARELGDRRTEGNTLGGLGRAYADLGEVLHAIELYEEQLDITRSIGDRRGEGRALGNLA